VGVGQGGGGGGGGGDESLTVGVDLVIDLSQSQPVPAGTQLDGVYLRVRADFYPLALTPEQIDALESGSLARRRITCASFSFISACRGTNSVNGTVYTSRNSFHQ
jgi:hypothetical protein